MANKSPRSSNVIKETVKDKPVLPGARPAHKITVKFECWSCRHECEVDLADIQQERLAIKYTEIKPNPNRTTRYFIKCTSCNRFNSVII